MYRLRHATAADTAFLRDLHHTTYREVVTRMFSWDEVKQDHYFSGNFDATAYQVIVAEQQDIGALSVQRNPTQWTLVEIQPLPAFQGRGIGTVILHDLLTQAQRQGCPLRLQVLKANRARQWYERLGFTHNRETSTHYLMEYAPNAANE